MKSRAEYQRLILQIDGWKNELAKWMDRAEAAELSVHALSHEVRRLEALLLVYGAPVSLIAVDPVARIGQIDSTRVKASSNESYQEALHRPESKG